MPIAPDTKDWTWVLDQPCPECGFDAASISGRAVAELTRGAAIEWKAILARPAVTIRPDENTWSPLEYAAHVRDVCRLFLERLSLMLTEEDPKFANWDQDATAVTQRYGEQDPRIVSSELAAAAIAIANAFDAVPGDAWDRTGRRSDGARFTVDSFARYFIHDVVHHVHDVSRSL